MNWKKTRHGNLNSKALLVAIFTLSRISVGGAERIIDLEGICVPLADSFGGANIVLLICAMAFP